MHMCRYLKKDAVLVPFYFLSVISIMVTLILLPPIFAINLIYLSIIIGLLLHNRKPRDESGVSEQKTDLREETQDIDKRLIQSLVVKLVQIIESKRNLVNDEINARQFQEFNPGIHLKVLKILILDARLTILVYAKKVQRLAEGMKFQVLQIDDDGIERILGTARISHVQGDGISHACVIDFKEKHLWNEYMERCEKAGECIPRYRMSIYVKGEETFRIFL